MQILLHVLNFELLNLLSSSIYIQHYRISRVNVQERKVQIKIVAMTKTMIEDLLTDYKSYFHIQYNLLIFYSY